MLIAGEINRTKAALGQTACINAHHMRTFCAVLQDDVLIKLKLSTLGVTHTHGLVNVGPDKSSVTSYSG